jgi:hypothetical protein
MWRAARPRPRVNGRGRPFYNAVRTVWRGRFRPRVNSENARVTSCLEIAMKPAALTHAHYAYAFFSIDGLD